MFITVGVVNMALGKKFILASNSASRCSLLKNAGLSFSKAPPLCNEEKIKKKLLQKKINKKNLPKHLAKQKALSVSRKNPNKLNYLYILTPKGISAKTKLTINFMHRKMQEYDELKKDLNQSK